MQLGCQHQMHIMHKSLSLKQKRRLDKSLKKRTNIKRLRQMPTIAISRSSTKLLNLLQHIQWLQGIVPAITFERYYAFNYKSFYCNTYFIIQIIFIKVCYLVMRYFDYSVLCYVLVDIKISYIFISITITHKDDHIIEFLHIKRRFKHELLINESFGLINQF